MQKKGQRVMGWWRLPLWSALEALLSTMATLRKTTCKEKNILQSWWPQFTHIVVCCLNQVKEHVPGERRACADRADTLLPLFRSQPLFLSREAQLSW